MDKLIWCILCQINSFSHDSKDRAVILLVGLPQLNSTLQSGVHEPLHQRIIMNYNLEGLSKDEGRIYISEKLKGQAEPLTFLKRMP